MLLIICLTSTAKVWKNGLELAHLSGHTQAVWSVKFLNNEHVITGK